MASLRDVRKLRKEWEEVKLSIPPPPVALPGAAEWGQKVSGLELDDWQKELLDSQSKRICILAARQTGKSESTAIKSAYHALANPGSTVLMIAPTHRQSKLIFDRTAALLSIDPDSGVVRRTQTELDLMNGSQIRALPGDNSDRLRGYTADLIILDEAAYIESGMLVSVFPMMNASAGDLIMISTPSGPSGTFHEVWNEGGEDWQKVKVTAQQCPRISEGMLTEALERLGPAAFEQEYNCSFVQNKTAFFNAQLVRDAFSDGGPSSNIVSLVKQAFQ